jgi:hypothetical protein
LHALFARPQAWRMQIVDAVTDARLPGAGVGRSDMLAVA